LLGGGDGRPLFYALSGYTGLVCIFAGPMFSANAIADERRDGTLQLLFLSTLNGADVVLGKFVSVSVYIFYGLLAVQPVMALPFIMGGVTGTEFIRVTLASLNALFFSLALGIFVSVVGRNTEKAVLRTVWALAFCCVMLPLLGVLFD